jgi:hypothetical protein
MKYLLMALLFSGCGGGTFYVVTWPSPTPTASASPSPSVVETLVSSYNAYLQSQGTDPITPGLHCELYNVPNMPATPCLSTASIAGCSAISSSSGFTGVASFLLSTAFNQPNEAGTAGFNLLPQALQGLYASNFEIVCTGYFINPDNNFHEFDVSSDDGSLLYIGGSLVVQNDGEHSVTDVKGNKFLQSEVYSFQLDYFQGPGNVALVVNEDGAVLSASNLYH